jgi:hypothetical protein
MALVAYLIAGGIFWLLQNLICGLIRALYTGIYYALFKESSRRVDMKNGLAAMIGVIGAAYISIIPFKWFDVQYKTSILMIIFGIVAMWSTLSTPEEHHPNAERIGVGLGMCVTYFFFL